MADVWEFPWDKAVTELLAEFPTHEVWAVPGTYGGATYSARRWGAHPSTTMIRETSGELREAIEADLAAGDPHPKARELVASLCRAGRGTIFTAPGLPPYQGSWEDTPSLLSSQVRRPRRARVTEAPGARSSGPFRKTAHHEEGRTLR